MASTAGQQKAAKVGAAGLNAYGQIQAGRAAAASGRFDARQLYRQANNTLATSQRSAEEIRRQAQLMESRARAVAAAGGGSTTDVGMTDLISNIYKEGELSALIALYEGKDVAAGLRDQAKVRKWEGKTAEKNSRLQAFSTVLGAFG